MRAYVVALPFVSPLVAGDFVWSLSGSSGGRWRLTQHGNASFQEVEAIVPGQVHLDLWRSHVIPDPYYGYNDTALRYVAEADWLYSTKFAVPREACDEAKVSLPATIFFYGIDTVADVTLNGCPILSADNMFRTYNATMKRGQLLCDRDNEMSVLLKSPVKTAKERAETYERKHSDWSIGVPPRELPAVWNGFDGVQMLRKEPCSFGWDWGPGLATSGIWKDVQVVTHQLERGRSLTVEGVTWDVKPISVTRLDAWQANVHISLALSPDIQVDRVSVGITLADGSSTPLYEGSWANLRIEDLRPGSRSGVNFTIRDGVKPWWPNGYGDQHRYTLNVCVWAGDKGDACEGDKITVGFKTVDLVMEKDDYGRSFYFKLNGESIFARGANWIPADAFESRVDESRLRKDFEQYRKAHFNMLRVWGGGVYASDLFYELADEYGFLIWEEAMFAGATYPTLLPGFLASVELEISQNLIRIGHHPSLAILGGNNEVEAFYGWVGITEDKVYLESYAALFFDTILATSKKLLPWLPAIPSSPWNGDETRQNPVDDNPGNETSGDIHFYNYFSPNMFDLRNLPKPRFMSEFGFQSWSSLRELKTVADEEMLEESLFSEDSKSWPFHRQHLVSGGSYLRNYVEYMFGTERGQSIEFMELRKAEAYLSQIIQGVWLKLVVEHCRRLQPYNMGLLYWQANDIWPTVSWSTIEYSGRPKVAMTMAQSFYNLSEPTMFFNYSISPSLFCVQASTESCQVRIFNLLTQKDVGQPWNLGPLELRCADVNDSCGDGQCVAFSDRHNYLILGSMAKFPTSHITRFARGTLQVYKGFITSQFAVPFVELECDNTCEENHLWLLPNQRVWVGEDVRVVNSLWLALESYRRGPGQDEMIVF